MVQAQYSEDQRDCLQEICNVAMGQAGDTLARKLGVFVTLSIPEIHIIEAGALSASLSNFSAAKGIYAASQLFTPDPLADTNASSTLIMAEGGAHELQGLALVMLSEESLDDLRQLLPAGLTDDERVIDTCRNMAQTCLDALSGQWGMGFQCQAPELVGHESLQAICQSVIEDWRHILVVEINYRLENRSFNGDLVLLFPDQAIAAMGKRLDQLLT